MRVTYITSVNHTLDPKATIILHAYNFATNPRKPAQTLAFAPKTSRKFGLSANDRHTWSGWRGPAGGCGSYGRAGLEAIRAGAEERKGGAAALNRLMPKPDPKALAAFKDDRALAEITKRVFSAGFAWSVIESKWPGFEEAFLGFDPARLAFEPDEFWEGLTKDARIVMKSRFRSLFPRRGQARMRSVKPARRLRADVAGLEHCPFSRTGEGNACDRPGYSPSAPIA
jgi:hypothetical protein